MRERVIRRIAKVLVGLLAVTGLVFGAALPAYAYTFILLLDGDVPLNSWQHVNTSLTYTAVKVVTGSPGYTALARVAGVGTSSGAGSVTVSFTNRTINYDCQGSYLSAGVVHLYCYVGTGSS